MWPLFKAVYIIKFKEVCAVVFIIKKSGKEQPIPSDSSEE